MTRAAIDKARERRRKNLELALAEAEAGRIAGIEGWESFSPAERSVVAVTPYFVTKVEAVAYAIGVNDPAKWYENHSVRNPCFRDACDKRREVACLGSSTGVRAIAVFASTARC